jgi:Zn-dependent peptidase ImmA (M78 family)
MVHVQPAAISKLESGRLKPSDGLLRALCEGLDVTPDYFAQPVADEYELHECSFRHLQSTPKKLLEEALARGTLYHDAITILATLAELPVTNVPVIHVSTVEEMEDAANASRRAWGIDPDEPIRNMVRLAEHAGVVVMRLRGTTEKVDAFSRFGEPPTIILTSVKGSTSKDRFNVAHELGHLVIHRGKITGDLQSEREANRFAAALLLPLTAFSADFRSLRAVDWPHLFELKQRWKVAGSAILHRAEELGLLSAIDARRLYKQHSFRRWNKGEPHEPSAETPELFELALQVATEDWNKDMRNVAADLGWGSRMTEIVTGHIIREAKAQPANVRSIADYLRQ